MSLVTVLEYFKQSWFEEIQILKSTVIGKFNHIYCWLIYYELNQCRFYSEDDEIDLCFVRPCKKCTFLTSERYLAGARSREFLQPMWAIQKTATVGICPHPYWQLREWKTFFRGLSWFHHVWAATPGNRRQFKRSVQHERLISTTVGLSCCC